MKKTAIALSSIAILLLCYFLFEPLFSYYIRRSEIPNLALLRPKIEYTDSVRNAADELLEKEFKSLQAPSLSVAIGLNDLVFWSNSIGYSDVENALLADSTTKYRIGSVSKTIASIGLGVLFQDKTLNPNSIVGDYVPYASSNLSKLTVKELASHTSGIRNYGTCLCLPIWEFYDNDPYNSIEESVSIFGNDKLLFEPGTDFSYSSYNYTLLSGVIEGASKMDYLEFIHNNVLEPLNLRQTIPNSAFHVTPNTSVFYEFEADHFSIAFPVNNSNKWAGGGYLSTPSDLVRFGNGILNHRLIDAAVTELLFDPVKLENREVNEQNYSMGWRNDVSQRVFASGRDVRIIHHGGTAAGSTAILVLIPEYNASIALAMNRSGATKELFDIAFKLLNLFLKERD